MNYKYFLPFNYNTNCKKIIKGKKNKTSKIISRILFLFLVISTK